MEAYEQLVEAKPAKKVKAAPTISEETFQPKGAIAFFVLLVLLGLIIWFGIYFLMLSRI
jgi:hypothetical protein